MTTSKISKLTSDLTAETKTAAAAKGSIRDHANMALADIATAFGKYLKSKFSDSLGSFGKPYPDGPYGMSVSADVKNSDDKGNEGDLIIAVVYDKFPEVEVSANFPKAKDYTQKYSFDTTDSPKNVVGRFGGGIEKGLSSWMSSVK